MSPPPSHPRESNALPTSSRQPRRNPDAHPATVFTEFRGSHRTVGRRDTATHWIHWYPAKMFHRIPAEILTASPPRGLTVLDPFCGSGTVLLEAAIRGHLAIGVDVNPLARLISSVKTKRLDVKSLSARAAQISCPQPTSRSAPDADQLPAYWFLPDARRALVQTHREIQDISYRPHRDFLRVTLSAIVRQSSLADPSVPPPGTPLPTTRTPRLRSLRPSPHKGTRCYAPDYLRRIPRACRCQHIPNV